MPTDGGRLSVVVTVAAMMATQEFTRVGPEFPSWPIIFAENPD
jgi:hypothetical protein